MRLRLAFKLHGEEADFARQLADAAKVPVDSIAKLAMQRYMYSVLDRAQEAMKQQQKTIPASGDGNVNPDQVHAEGIAETAADSVSSDAS